MIKRVLQLFPTAQRLIYELEVTLGKGRNKAKLIPDMITIGAFEKKLFTEFFPDVKPIGQVASSLLLADVLRKRYSRSQSGPFKKIWRYPGFQNSLQQLFNELGQGLVDDSILSNISGYAFGKDGEISDLYREYKKEIKTKGFTDQGSLKIMLLDVLDDRGLTCDSFLGGFGSVTLKDIYQFTPYRFEMFRKLSNLMPVKIIAPLPDGRKKAFGFMVTNLSKFEALAEHDSLLEIGYEVQELGPISPLADTIFQIGPEINDKRPAIPQIPILSCTSRYREIEEVCANIKERREENGLEWSDFCLVFRDTRPYGAIVENVFTRYKVPFTIKRSIPLRQNPLVRVCLSLLELADSGFDRAGVAEIITSSYFNRFSSLDKDDVQRFFLEARIIDGKPALWKNRLKSALAERKGALKKSGQNIARVTCELLKRVDQLTKQDRALQFFECYRNLLNWLKLTPRSGSGGQTGEKIKFRDFRAYTSFFNLLEEFIKYSHELKIGLTPIGFDKARLLFNSAVDSQTSDEISSVNSNKVFVLNAHDIVGLRFKHVYVGGLHEGEFPKGIFQNQLLTEEERRRFNKIHLKIIEAEESIRLGRRVFDSDVDKWQEESLLFFQTIRMAKDSITFSHSYAELDGKPLLESMFLASVKDTTFANALDVDRRKNLEEITVVTTKPLALQKPMEKLLDQEERQAKILYDLFRPDASQNKRLPADMAIVFKGAAGEERFQDLLGRAVIERKRNGFLPSEPNGIENFSKAWLGLLTDSIGTLRGFVGKEKHYKYSPTSLESYGQCPFRFFVSKPLGLLEPDEIEFEMDVRTRGTLYHSIAEKFYRKKIKEKSLPLSGKESEWATLKETVIKVFSECNEKLGDPRLWKVESEQIMAVFRRFWEAEVKDQKQTGYTPVAVELSFDFADKWKPDIPPIKLEITPGEERLLVGRIDRVDVKQDGSGARVIDYKSGSNSSLYKKKIKKEMLGKETFQPLIYSMAAKNYLLASGLLKPTGFIESGYRLIDEKDFKKAYVTTSFDDEKSFKALVAKMILDIESGRFPVDPVECGYCNFAGLCRLSETDG
tara:strand:+ start:9029 stop:12220 length:3192 start_codon:yes stop_codon:yes gene_type:complete